MKKVYIKMIDQEAILNEEAGIAAREACMKSITMACIITACLDCIPLSAESYMAKISKGYDWVHSEKYKELQKEWLEAADELWYFGWTKGKEHMEELQDGVHIIRFMPNPSKIYCDLVGRF